MNYFFLNACLLIHSTIFHRQLSIFYHLMIPQHNFYGFFLHFFSPPGNAERFESNIEIIEFTVNSKLFQFSHKLYDVMATTIDTRTTFFNFVIFFSVFYIFLFSKMPIFCIWITWIHILISVLCLLKLIHFFVSSFVSVLCLHFFSSQTFLGTRVWWDV